jgi:6-phosphofructokinase 1
MKKIAVFTSGGDAPGMNACIRAVVRGAAYNGIEVVGIYRGYQGMIEGDFKHFVSRDVANILQRGGTILKSSRCADFHTVEGRKKAFEQLKKEGVQGIIAIGGDGTFTGAEIFHKEYKIPIIGVPGTIDNDLYGTDYTIGFSTAVNTVLDAIDKLRDTAASHQRAFFIEVMGRNSGYIALNSGIGGGAEMVIIPDTKIPDVIDAFNEGQKRGKTSFIVVVAEGDEVGRAAIFAKKVKEALPSFDIRVTILGHTQRGGSPSANDRLLASRLGLAAVNALLDGKTNLMVGVSNDQISYTPFLDTFTKKKQLSYELLEAIKILSV